MTTEPGDSDVCGPRGVPGGGDGGGGSPACAGGEVPCPARGGAPEGCRPASVACGTVVGCEDAPAACTASGAAARCATGGCVTPASDESAAERCTDGVDNDGNGFADRS